MPLVVTVRLMTLRRLPVVPPSRMPSRSSRALTVWVSICILPQETSRAGELSDGMWSIRFACMKAVNSSTAPASSPARGTGSSPSKSSTLAVTSSVLAWMVTVESASSVGVLGDAENDTKQPSSETALRIGLTSSLEKRSSTMTSLGLTRTSSSRKPARVVLLV